MSYMRKEKVEFYGNNKYLENPENYDNLGSKNVRKRVGSIL